MKPSHLSRAQSAVRSWQLATITHLLPTAAVCCLLVLSGCKKDPIYEVDPVTVLPFGGDKDKLKTNEQWVAILHANLFQTALSANELFEISQCFESIGDRDLAREVLISNFFNETGVIMPSDSVMRLDINAFVDDTYVRFLVRHPTEAEKTWFRNYIEADPHVTPELVYFSFALSNEYLYY